jgi:signal transduction histidine kinase
MPATSGLYGSRTSPGFDGTKNPYFRHPYELARRVLEPALMANSNVDSRLALREAVQSLLAPEVTGPLDELSDALLQASSLLSRLRRRLRTEDANQGDLGSLDESFSRSIVLTRLLRERCQAPRARCEYTSLCHAAREVVGRLQEALPDRVSLSLRCSPGPAIVATDRENLRRLVLALLESALDALEGEGELELDVSEQTKPGGARGGPDILVELRSSGVVEEHDERIRTSAYPVVGALHGTIVFQKPSRGGTVIAIRLPCACCS